MIDPKKMAELVARAKNGDDDAVSQLYSDCYGRIFYVIKSIVGDEETAMDLLQDTFLKAFKSINSLEDNQAFYAWLKRIAINTSKNWLIKSRPILFSDLQNPTVNDEEDAEPVENVFEDPKLENMPEEVVDKAEVSRLLNEILDSLPADQRLAICMFYYDDMSLKEIAEVMDVPLSTVKNRLAYGRKKVEQKVLDLEKRGTKIYGLAPIAFLIFLFKGMETQAKELHPDQTALNSFRKAVQAGQNQSAATDMAGKVAKEATKAGKKVVETVGIKTLVIIGAVAVIGIAGIGLLGGKNTDKLGSVQETYVERESETSSDIEELGINEEQCFMEQMYYLLSIYKEGDLPFGYMPYYGDLVKENKALKFAVIYDPSNYIQKLFLSYDDTVCFLGYHAWYQLGEEQPPIWPEDVNCEIGAYNKEKKWYLAGESDYFGTDFDDRKYFNVYSEEKPVYELDFLDEEYVKFDGDNEVTITKEEAEDVLPLLNRDLSGLIEALEWHNLEDMDEFFAPYLE